MDGRIIGVIAVGAVIIGQFVTLVVTFISDYKAKRNDRWKEHSSPRDE